MFLSLNNGNGSLYFEKKKKSKKFQNSRLKNFKILKKIFFLNTKKKRIIQNIKIRL